MQSEMNKSLIHEFLQALSGKPKPASVVHHYIAEGDETLRRHVLHYERAFPRFELIAQDMFTMGECILVHLCIRGIHMGDLWSLPPAGMQGALPLRSSHHGDFTGLASTGNQISLPMTVLYRVSKDAIIEHRMRYNADDLLRQLGLSSQWPHKTVEFSAVRGRGASLWRKVAPVNP